MGTDKDMIRTTFLHLLQLQFSETYDLDLEVL
jgi:hypothetical protein